MTLPPAHPAPVPWPPHGALPPWPQGAAGRVLVLTDAAQLPSGVTLTQQVAGCVEGGARVVVLRERHLADPQRRHLGSEAARLLASVGGLLLWAAPAPDVVAHEGTPGHGVHLPARLLTHGPRPATRGDDVTGSVGGQDGGRMWRGASIHNAAELRRAADAECHYVTASPYAATASKPGYGPALGGGGLRALALASPVPVLALGGVTPEQVQEVGRMGAAGIAVMGALMRTRHPDRECAAYISAAQQAWGEDPTHSRIHTDA